MRRLHPLQRMRGLAATSSHSRACPCLDRYSVLSTEGPRQRHQCVGDVGAGLLSAYISIVEPWLTWPVSASYCETRSVCESWLAVKTVFPLSFSRRRWSASSPTDRWNRSRLSAQGLESGKSPTSRETVQKYSHCFSLLRRFSRSTSASAAS